MASNSAKAELNEADDENIQYTVFVLFLTESMLKKQRQYYMIIYVLHNIVSSSESGL